MNAEDGEAPKTQPKAEMVRPSGAMEARARSSEPCSTPRGRSGASTAGFSLEFHGLLREADVTSYIAH